MGLLEKMVDHGIAFKINDKRGEMRVISALNGFSMRWMNGKKASDYAPSEEHDNFVFPYWILCLHNADILWHENIEIYKHRDPVIIDSNESLPDEVYIYLAHCSYRTVSKELEYLREIPHSKFDSCVLEAIESLREKNSGWMPDDQSSYGLVFEFVKELKYFMFKK